MAKFRFEVYEDNAGGLTMFVIDETGAPVWGHGGYEYTPENLWADMDAVKVLEDVEELEAWEGNGAYYGGGDFDAWEDTAAGSVQAAYEQVSCDQWTELVADSDGMYLDRAGLAAREALGE